MDDLKVEMPGEDLLRVRELMAERGCELTPQELLDTLNQVAQVTMTDEPGLVSLLRERDRWREGQEDSDA